MTPADCIRAAIPGASDETCQHIVWGRTPFPFKKLTARDFYKAASRLQRASNNGLRLCDWCDNIAVDGWCCKACNDVLSGPHPDEPLRAQPASPLNQENDRG